MSTTITDLEPQKVWKYFDEITKIPRPSGHEKKIAEYLSKFAKEHNFECVIDKVGNVIIDVPATSDKQNAPLVILQGHMDMVPVAAEGFTFDFKKDPIKTFIDGPFVKAERTTLGADNGIALAMALSIFDDKELSHGPLRAIFTVEEETTMKGAANIDPKYLKAEYLINLDSEDNGFLFVNCAGSNDVDLSFNFSKIVPENTKALTLKISNLEGGHSGADIALYRANAIKVLATILDNLSDDFDFFIQDIKGGTVRNSIPAKASVTLAVPENEVEAIKEAFKTQFDEQKSIYKNTDPNMECAFENATSKDALGYALSLDLIHLLRGLPSGVVRMSDEFKGIVETSINLSMVSMKDDTVKIDLMPRSLSKIGLNDIISTVQAQCYLLDNVEIEVSGYHEPWSSPSKNRLIDVLNDSYKEETGKPFEITALHAGVECAMFAKYNSELQLISIGPTVLNPHSPMERVDIKGTKEIYSTVIRALAML